MRQVGKNRSYPFCSRCRCTVCSKFDLTYIAYHGDILPSPAGSADSSRTQDTCLAPLLGWEGSPRPVLYSTSTEPRVIVSSDVLHLSIEHKTAAVLVTCPESAHVAISRSHERVSAIHPPTSNPICFPACPRFGITGWLICFRPGLARHVNRMVCDVQPDA
jgi:hypothetical protein